MQSTFAEEDEIKGGFKKIPIDKSPKTDVEIYHMYSSSFPYAKERLKKKMFKYTLITIVTIVCLFIAKKLIWDGLVELFSDDEEEDNYYKEDFTPIQRFNQSLEDDGLEYNEGEKFYLNQTLEQINMDSLSSPQLKNPKNIKLINTLEITLEVEYDKFVHLKIKDAENKRWEIPKEEVLNKEYLYYLSENRIPLSIYSNYLESKTFFIEFLTNKFNREDMENYRDINLNQDEDYSNVNEFSFRIMSIYENQIYSFNSSKNFIFSDNYINFQSEITSDDIYGFGERTHDFKLGEGLYTIWPQGFDGTKYDKGLGGGNGYGHFPVALHKTMYENLWMGFIFLNTNAQDVKITKTNNSQVNLEHKTLGGIIDYYMIIDESPEEVLKDIQYLLGIPTLPPFWSLGNHQSRYGYKDFEEFKSVYELYKKYEIPIDTMWLDIDAMDNYEVFTINSKFKQISSYVQDEIHKDGGKFVPIVDLGFSCENKNNPLIQLGNSLNIFITSNFTKKPLVSKVWPGKAVFPDFMNPKISEFWNKGLNDYQKLINYDGIWLDMNEPTTLLENEKCFTEIAKEDECTKDKNQFDKDNLVYLPGYNAEKGEYILSNNSISENALVCGNLTVYDTKPLISYLEGKKTYEYLNTNINTRPFILSRGTSFGSGKYVFHWLGDNFSEESNIKNSVSGIFNFNIFGIPFIGADICGFFEDSNKDLCLRWYNLGAFYPFMRNHNDKDAKDQYPWSFKDDNGNNNYDAIKLIKNNINCRYSLLRYMYSQLFLISLNEKGSFFKPIMFEFPEDKSSYEDIENKIMFGEAFLICAFNEVNEKDKEFIFPKEGFNRYPTGKLIMNKNDANNKITLSGKLDEVHIFLREGFIVPKQNTFEKYVLNTMKLREEKLDLIINVNSLKQSHGVIFFDNDDANTISDKKYYKVELNFTDNVMNICTEKNNLAKYNYNDHILGTIELWNANNVFPDANKEENKDKKYCLEIQLAKEKKDIEGNYDLENNKLVFNINGKEKGISLFDINKILFNFK